MTVTSMCFAQFTWEKGQPSLWFQQEDDLCQDSIRHRKIRKPRAGKIRGRALKARWCILPRLDTRRRFGAWSSAHRHSASGPRASRLATFCCLARRELHW